MFYKLLIILILCTQCQFEPILSSKSTNDINFTIHSKNKFLIYNLKRLLNEKLKIIKHLSNQNINIKVEIADLNDPLVYNIEGEVERWHTRLITHVKISNYKSEYKETLILHSSYKDHSDYGNVYLQDINKEKLTQQLIEEIIFIVHKFSKMAR